MATIFTLVGLGIILAAWAFQLTLVLQKKKELDRNFVGMYITGLVIYTLGNSQGLDFPAAVNMAIATIGVILFLNLKK